MISDFLKLFDSILSLTKESEKTKRNLFEDHIQPVFLDLTTIHNDYIQSFEKILEDFHDLPQSKELILNVLKKKQAEFEFLRIKSFEIAKIYTEENLRELPKVASEFFLSVANYFSTTSHSFMSYRTNYSAIMSHIEKSEFLLATQKDRPYITATGRLVYDDLGYEIYISKEKIKQRWTELSAAYARARIKLLV